MKAIAAILGMKPNSYKMMVFDNYLAWCDLNSVNDNDLQALLSNASLHKWFMNIYNQLEVDFYAKYNGDKNQRINQYATATMKISEYYPPRMFLKSIRTASKKNITQKHNLN